MRRPKREKLYFKIKNVSLAESVLEFRGGSALTYRVDYQKLPTAAFVNWPSGKPCLPVNMYLLDKCYSYTGETVVTVAAKLTELVRYCGGGRPDGAPCEFRDLNDGDIALIVNRLCTDTYLDDTSERLRNNNTVRAIMHSIFDFLDWYQSNLMVSGGRLIGERRDGASITIKIKQNSKTRRNYYDHRYLPPSVSTDPKLPIDLAAIEAIITTIDELEDRESHTEAELRRFGGDEDFLSRYLTYLAARRNFMIFLMRTTGLRPEEMSRLSVASIDKSVRSDKPFLVLPTMKRRSLEPPPRNFPISSGQAMRVILYLRSRAAWLKYCCSHRSEAIKTDAMFLSVGPSTFGDPISKGGLQKDFKEICNRAGFRDQQSCFSMFRHRFITDLLYMYLMAFDQQKSELNKQDYRMVLEKVREKTGHKSVNSLWHYIDLVRGMKGVWDPVNAVIKSTHEVEQLRYELRELRKQSRIRPLETVNPTDFVDRFDQLLSEFLDKHREFAGKLS